MEVNNIKTINKALVKSKATFSILITTLVFVLVVSIICGIILGPVKIDVKHVFKIIINHISQKDYFDPIWKRSTDTIVWQIRFPRVMMGAIAGVGLSISGICMQTLTKNSLAGPYVLGISSGASTGAVAAIILGVFSGFGMYAVSIGAFLGAIISSCIVFTIAHTNGEFTATKLVLTGMAVSAIFSSFTNILVFSAKDEQLVKSALFWMTGSVSGIKWSQLLLPLVVVVFSTGILQIINKSLNGMLLGDNVAITLGISVKKMRNILLLVTTILTGVIVSLTGVIGFVGLVIPHAARTIVGSEHSKVIPVSCFLGAILLIWADIGARLIFAPEEIPIGVITSLIGAPFFLWLLKRGSYSFGGRR